MSESAVNSIPLEIASPSRVSILPSSDGAPTWRQTWSRHGLLITALIAGLFLLVGFLSEKFNGPLTLTYAGVGIAFAIGLWPGGLAALQSLKQKRLDIDVLMVIGALLAAAIGQPTEGALLLFLFALSGALEKEATRRTHAAIHSLRELNPLEAIVLDDSGAQRNVNTEQVTPGMRVLVRAGDRVPLDGRILDGHSAIDESPITGEPIAKDKQPGDSVFAGTINTNGVLTVEVTRAADDTQLARIIRLVTDAQNRKPRIQRLFDRFSAPYSLFVLILTTVFAVIAPFVLAISWTESIYRAIALLIVACPCALIIGTPTAYVSAIASAARKGVLVKGGVFLERLDACHTLLFDKTGTLTEGRPKVARIVPLNGATESEALQLAGGLESTSTHPLAAAVTQLIQERGLTPAAIDGIENVPGRGVQARHGHDPVAIGSVDFVTPMLTEDLATQTQSAAHDLRTEGFTVSALVDHRSASLLAFEDPIRTEAPTTIAQLRAQGIKDLVMLTGDHTTAAQRIGRELGLDQIHAELLPEDKVRLAEELQRGNGAVAMVGDGINDAPALARADVGVAVASIGSDAALEAASIVLMGGSIEQLAWLHRHARRTARIVRQNLALAIGVIIALSGFAMTGTVDLPIAVIGHEGSTLVVALNAMRLLRA